MEVKRKIQLSIIASSTHCGDGCPGMYKYVSMDLDVCNHFGGRSLKHDSKNDLNLRLSQCKRAEKRCEVIFKIHPRKPYLTIHWSQLKFLFLEIDEDADVIITYSDRSKPIGEGVHVWLIPTSQLRISSFILQYVRKRYSTETAQSPNMPPNK